MACNTLTHPDAMKIARVLAPIVLILAAAEAAAACAPLRFGYPDQHRPPYYMGSGSTEPDPPGASIELVREIAASAGCPVQMLRMPPLRTRVNLELGQIDATPLEASELHIQAYALPLDRQGKLDHEKTLRNYTVVYVRAADLKAAAADPEAWLQTHTLGLVKGSPNAPLIRSKGVLVDDGAVDYLRNLEKLKRRRIDAFALTVIELDDIDSLVSTHFGSELVRLEKPIRTSHIYLAVSKAYYAANKDHVETMWNWIGAHAQARLSQLSKRYEAMP